MTDVTETCDVENPEIYMTRELWNKIVILFREVHEKHKSEVLVWLVAEKKDPLRVIDFYVPEQEVSGAACETEGEENYDRYFLRVWRETNDRFVCGSMHSHAEMGVFHSGTDDHDVENQAYINLNERLPFIDITSNIKGACKARVCLKKDCGAVITKDVDEITFPDMENAQEYDFEEVIKKVKKKVFSFTKFSYGDKKSYYDIPYEVREAVEDIGKYPISVIVETITDLVKHVEKGEEAKLIVRLACGLYRLKDAKLLEKSIKDLDYETARNEVNKRQNRERTTLMNWSEHYDNRDPWGDYYGTMGMEAMHFRYGLEAPDEDGAEEETGELLEELNSPKERDPKGRTPHVG